jgi:hypothetical protein
MDIEKSWNDLKPEDMDWDKMVKESISPKWLPLDPLYRLKKNLRINIGWGVLICIIYIVAIILLTLPIFRISMIFLLGFTLWAIYTTIRLYKSIEPGITSKHSLLEDMQLHYNAINNWMKAQEKAALIFYPIGILGGFFMGGVVGSGKTVSELLMKPAILIAIPIILLVLVPASHNLAKWMNKKAFGDHLIKLKENIDHLKNG